MEKFREIAEKFRNWRNGEYLGLIGFAGFVVMIFISVTMSYWLLFGGEHAFTPIAIPIVGGVLFFLITLSLHILDRDFNLDERLPNWLKISIMVIFIVAVLVTLVADFVMMVTSRLSYAQALLAIAVAHVSVWFMVDFLFVKKNVKSKRKSCPYCSPRRKGIRRRISRISKHVRN